MELECAGGGGVVKEIKSPISIEVIKRDLSIFSGRDTLGLDETVLGKGRDRHPYLQLNPTTYFSEEQQVTGAIPIKVSEGGAMRQGEWKRGVGV